MTDLEKSTGYFSSEENNDRLARIMNALLEITTGNFDEILPISRHGDTIDAISLAINTLVEELDYSEQKIAMMEELSRVSQEKKLLAAIIENSDDAIVSKTLDGEISTWNLGASKMYGYSADEMIGRIYTCLVPDGLHDENRKVIDRIRMGEVISHFETRRIRKDKSLIEVSITYSPIVSYEGGIIGVSAICRDITTQKLHEKLLIEYARTVEESNNELNQFAYAASHDLKEPLRGISNYSKFLLEDYSDILDSAGKMKLETLVRLSGRMRVLIDTLLKYSRVGRTKIKLVDRDLGGIVNIALDSLSALLEESGTKVQLEGRFPIVSIDPVLMTEVFQNLISNAMKYNEAKSKVVTIGYKFDEKEQKHLISVKDNGIGIDIKHHDKVFRIFKKLNSKKDFGDSTGAGLTIVKKIVEKHGGEIWLESKLNIGTTFYFTIPIKKD